MEISQIVKMCCFEENRWTQLARGADLRGSSAYAKACREAAQEWGEAAATLDCAVGIAAYDALMEAIV